MFCLSNVILISSVLNLSACYKLLLVFPYPSRSHVILGEGYVKHLLDAGHEITYITSSTYKISHPHLRQIEVESIQKFLKSNGYSIDHYIDKDYEGLNYYNVLGIMTKIASTILMDEKIQRLLNDTTAEFDGVIVERMYNELYAGFSAVFNCPLIWSASMDTNWMDLRIMGEIPTNNAFETSKSSRNFAFWNRVQELYAQIRLTLWYNWYMFPKEIEIYNQAYNPGITKRGRSLPPLEVMRLKGSMMLANTHALIGHAMHLPQNYKLIGGYHIIDSNKEPFTDDLKLLMDNSTNGVIFFSMGSVIVSQKYPQKMIRDLFEVFATFNQTIIWKNDEVHYNTPKNVHLIKWAPQQRILSHPNTILFITHGGVLSVLEALHFAVPMIGIPAFADQFKNIARMVDHGMAKQFRFTSDLPWKLKVAITDIIGDPRYTKKAKELSSIYHHRLVPAGAELSHWVQHTVLTCGAPHLRSRALSVPLWHQLYLDLMCLILFILLTFGIVLKKVFDFLIRQKVGSKKTN